MTAEELFEQMGEWTEADKYVQLRDAALEEANKDERFFFWLGYYCLAADVKFKVKPNKQINEHGRT